MKRRVFKGILFSLSGVLVFISVMYGFSVFLTVNAPLQTRHHLIEGWVGPYETEHTLDLLDSSGSTSLYVVGKRFDEREPKPENEPYFWRLKDGLTLWTNATAFFDPELFQFGRDTLPVLLSFELSGSSVANIFTHVTIVINGNYAGSFFTTGSKSTYQMEWIGQDPVHSVGICYDNDLATKKEGRYLMVHSVRIGGQIFVPVPGNTIVTFVRSKKTTGYDSEAAQKATYLTDLGVDPEQIRVIEYDPGTLNQTLLAAEAFRKWSRKKDISALNVISAGYHSRRSWLTYRRILAPEIQVGILTYPGIQTDDRTPGKNKQRFINLLDESISYVGNWFYFTFANSDQNEDRMD